MPNCGGCVTATIALLLGLMGLLCPLRAAGQQNTPHVLVIPLRDTIQPVSEEYLARGLKRAADQRADAVLVELDTPGGLLDSTRNMVRMILDSQVPVIFWVGPSGSRAGSAGFFLLESADLAAMSPGTNAGAAHPVIEGKTLDPVMKQKIENDATAFLRSYTTRRGRNPAAAEEAVMNSKSYSDQEAKQLGLIDVIAPTQTALLDSIDGRVIKRFDGTTTTLRTRGAQLTTMGLTIREQILDKLMDPNLALLILVIGALLIYLEFNTPGTIVPGALGTLLVLLSLFALNLLPVRYTAVALLLAAFVLLLLEAKFASHGVLAAAGILSMVIGALTLVAAPIPELRVHTATAISLAVAFGGITVFLVRLAVRARRRKVKTGLEALVGEVGVAMQSLQNTGQVMVHGELWQAESSAPVLAGQQVRVRGFRSLNLLVEQIPVNGPQA